MVKDLMDLESNNEVGEQTYTVRAYHTEMADEQSRNHRHSFNGTGGCTTSPADLEVERPHALAPPETPTRAIDIFSVFIYRGK